MSKSSGGIRAKLLQRFRSFNITHERILKSIAQDAKLTGDAIMTNKELDSFVTKDLRRDMAEAKMFSRTNSLLDRGTSNFDEVQIRLRLTKSQKNKYKDVFIPYNRRGAEKGWYTIIDNFKGQGLSHTRAVEELQRKLERRGYITRVRYITD